MALYFFDSSALAKRYVHEQGSVWLRLTTVFSKLHRAKGSQWKIPMRIERPAGDAWILCKSLAFLDHFAPKLGAWRQVKGSMDSPTGKCAAMGRGGHARPRQTS